MTQRLVTIFAVLLLFVGLPPLTTASILTSEEETHHTSSFGSGASAAIAVDLTTGIELFSFNADVRVLPASTIKIVTALVAVRILPKHEVVVIEESDILDSEIFSVMGLLTGDTVRVDALLYGLLVASGGDAALALARAAGSALDPTAEDPVHRFVAEMNAFSASLGMTSTNITNPTGADDPGSQYTTARDLAKAAEALLDDWMLAKVVATGLATVSIGGPNARAIELSTTNLLLESDDVFGVKTGTEDEAGQCLITGVWRGDNRIVTVVLGSEDRYADTWELLDIVDSRYRWVALGVGARALGVSEELEGIGLEFKTRRTVIMTVAQMEHLTWVLVHNDGTFGLAAGVVHFTTDGRDVARIPVY